MSELIKSDTAIKNNINNRPDTTSLDNMLKLIVFCLQPIREKLGKPMTITSGYRNSQVNKLLNGSTTSEHVKGMAADFVVSGMTVEQVVAFIRKCGVKFTQLIEEHSGTTVWTHISYNPNNLKCEVLRYKNGTYTKI
jgi:uncharacterized protein YcbK (DUF882 family)